MALPAPSSCFISQHSSAIGNGGRARASHRARHRKCADRSGGPGPTNVARVQHRGLRRPAEPRKLRRRHGSGRALGPYSASKLAQETIARKLEGERGLKVTIVRPANVFGPGSGPWVDELCRQLQAGNPTLVAGGNFAAGLVYVDNVVDVMVRASERIGAVGRTYNANDESGVTWERYVGELAKLIGSKPPRSVPRLVAMASAHLFEATYRLLHRKRRPSVTREALNLCRGALRIPVDRARRELGYEPLISFEQGMVAVAEYLRRSGLAKGNA